ncbi:MAG: response regulator transcription factor, partial [Desulfovibrio sp.]|nr:response regulator transcription factor [Desulfovibrio sp.]
GVGGAPLAVAEGCFAAALLSLPGKRAESVALPVGQTLCCAALAGNLAAQLGLLGARSDGASHILLMAAACAALGAAVCAVQIARPLWRGRRSRARNVTADPVLALLTAQEKLVFGLLGEGCGNRDIAERLNISEATVRFHLRAIYKKTGQDGRPQLEALARRHTATSDEHA